MNFELKYGLIWIAFEFVYDGKIVEVDNCILDTGSATTAVDTDLVDFNYEKPAILRRLIGIGGGTHEVAAQKVDKIIIDGIELKDIEIEFGNIQADIGINGFIGNDILRKHTITIDYRAKEIDLKYSE